MLGDWLKKLVPLFYPIRSKTKTKRDSFSRTSRQLQVFFFPVLIGSLDWFCPLWIGQRNYFGFGFTKPLLKHIFYNDCLISRALIGSFLSSIRVQTDKILIYASFQVQLSATF